MTHKVWLRQKSNRRGAADVFLVGDLRHREIASAQTCALASVCTTISVGADQLSAAQAQIVRRAALTSAMAEDLAAEWLAGEPIDPMLFCTLFTA